MQTQPQILFDISRLLLRLRHAVPTGIDRVELAYAEHLLRHDTDRTSFLLGLPGGIWGRVPIRRAAGLVEAVGAHWRSGGGRVPRRMIVMLVVVVLVDALRRFCRLAKPLAGRSVYLNVSHQHLDRPRTIAAILDWTHARFVVMVHDLIPIMFPEYGRPGQAERHRRRISTVMGLADGVLVNSRDTSVALAAHIPECAAPVLIAPLGVDVPGRAPACDAGRRMSQKGLGKPALAGQSYFVCLGTIEPRKNHLLLLHVWRQLVSQGGAVPHLHVIGRRGWENEMVVDLLESCVPIHRYVHECNNLPDDAVRALLRGARALLCPSFAEGYGLPLAEALAEGVPVLCSDLPAHREIGGAVPEYLDPLDGPAWTAAVRDYAMADSPCRAAQLARLAGWCAPNWTAHLQAALGFASAQAAADTLSPAGLTSGIDTQRRYRAASTLPVPALSEQ